MRNTAIPRAGRTIVNPLQRYGGFTLLEIMIVVVIIGILAAIAYPSYQGYVTEARRTEGQRLLLLTAAQQERFYSQCGYYAISFTPAATAIPVNLCNASAATGVLGVKNNLADIPYYSLTVIPDPAPNTNDIRTSFLLTATPSGIQLTNDTQCGNLTLSSQGVKGQTGPLGVGCWKR